MSCAEPLLICGDFNMIYMAADKSRSMRRFRRAIDSMRRPTLERIDRAFATMPWLECFPDHRLRSLAVDRLLRPRPAPTSAVLAYWGEAQVPF